MIHEALLTLALKRIIKAIAKHPVNQIPEIAEAVQFGIYALKKVSGDQFDVKSLFEKRTR